MGDVVYFNAGSREAHEGLEKQSANAIQMQQDARTLSRQADADTGLAGYLMVSLQQDGSWRTCFLHPAGTMMSKTMFAAFVKEVITRDLTTASEVRWQNGEEC